MKNLVATVNNLKTSYTDSKDACVLETNSEPGKNIVTTVSDSEPIITSVYVDTTDEVLDENGSTVTTVTRKTTVTNTITRTTTVKTTPYTIYTYDDGSTETEYSEATYTTSTQAVVTVQDPTFEIISETVTANEKSTTTTNTVTSSYVDSEPTITTSTSDGSANTSEVVTDGSSSTSTTTSDGDPTSSSSYVDTTVTVDNGDGTSTTTVTRTTTTTTVTPRHTRTLVTFVRNTKTYSTFTRTTTETSTVVRTTTTNTTPVTIVTWTDGTKTSSSGSTVVTTSTENIVSSSTSTEDITTLVSNVDITVTQSDTTSTENITTTSTTSEVISSTTTANNYTTSDPEYYQTDEYKESGKYRDTNPLDVIHANDAYARGWTGDGVKVGVLDTGVKCDHNDLKNNLTTTRYTNAYGDGCNDTYGHGTQVAGIIAAEKNNVDMHGVAYDAEIHFAKIGNGPSVWIQQYGPNAASQMADNGVVAVNLSANTRMHNGTVDAMTTIEKDGSTLYYTDVNWYDATSINEWKVATDKGIIVVNSAGNQGKDIPAQPGNYATDVDANGNLTLDGLMIIVGSPDGYSNKAGHVCHDPVITNGTFTGCNDTYLTKNYYIVAPGSNITTTDNGGVNANETKTGTSFAAPHVTGAIAILKQAWPQLSAQEIVQLLLTTATDMGEEGVDDVYGVGMLNLDNATNPNGTSSISTISGTTNLNGTSLSASSAVGDSLSEIDVLSSTMIVDDYNRDYYVDLNQTISTNTNALTLNHNFMSFAGTEHVTMNGYTFAINDSDVNNIALGYQHNNCNYLVGNLHETNTFYGTSGSGALSIGGSETQHIGIDCNKNGFSIKYNVGTSSINGADGSIITSGTAIADTWMLGYTNNKWKFTFGQPLAVIQGEMEMALATSISNEGVHEYTNYKVNIEPEHRHTVATIGYTDSITDNVSLNMNIEYNNNYANQDQDTWSLTTGVKYEF
jgi:subtilisin family serine protease